MKAEEFADFFREANGGEEPFPWQERLAALVLERGWPDALDVPTGAGKTSAIDVAVFHLALEAQLALDPDRAAERKAARRILFVVDRRLVVDDAFGRARRLASEIAGAERGVLRKVRERLAVLAEDEAHPLQVVRLRGGVPREPDWIRIPSQPAVVVSTVDQVGSRFFFRGYGVSDTMKPVHAGIVGNDALYLLDEAHLSQPFVCSLRDAQKLGRPENKSAVEGLEAPLQVVTLSATQTDKAPPLLRNDDRKHPVLGPRLTGSKLAELVELKTAPGEREWAQDCASHAMRASVAGGGPATVVAVVVNRVRHARSVFAELKRQVRALPEESKRPDVALLIGRSRPVDRDEKVRELLPRVGARRQPAVEDVPLFVVATQCVEAGADLDFDALVTEIAPLDCLRQRFGRLNRMGRSIDARTRAAVVASAEQVGVRAKPDPLYGQALSRTWALLCEHAVTGGKGTRKERTIDFGVEPSRSWLPEGTALQDCVAPRRQAPVLMPAFLEQWSMTSPIPATEPEVSLFLHGPATGVDVQIVWRADLSDDPDDRPRWAAKVGACPPSPLEAIAVPIGEARRWLMDLPAGDLPDAEGPLEDGEVSLRRPGSGGSWVLRWRGSAEDSELSQGGRRLAPGDVIVVPAARGGCDEWGWAPGSLAAVRDVAYGAVLRQRGREVLRLSEALLLDSPDFREDAANARKAARRLHALLDELIDTTERDALTALRSEELLPATWKESLGRPGSWEVERDGKGRWLALSRKVSPEERQALLGAEPVDVDRPGDAVTEDDRSSLNRMKPVLLRHHSKGVGERARHLAGQCGLPPSLCADLWLAGFLHDAGKAHPHFKCWLYGGDELA
ncbi:MAG TPA: type I-U CRISPR-associated helicase/endonuclease Cas3, partial [Myxococcales bacterium]|nr:type I-U CRISPR-associated helicase/endonuclease Cas3 [Myxococcales bacterium]